jgi:biotin carboxyl carrier protein
MSRVILIDGEPIDPIEADVVEAEPGVFSVLVNGRSYDVRISDAEISIGPHKFAFELEDPRVWKRSVASADSHGRVSIKAAMPGKVVRILVAVGDDVEAGQGILVVEAMKMQNELKSPRAGRVISIEVKANDSVTAGMILAGIE